MHIESQGKIAMDMRQEKGKDGWTKGPTHIFKKLKKKTQDVLNTTRQRIDTKNKVELKKKNK